MSSVNSTIFNVLAIVLAFTCISMVPATEEDQFENAVFTPLDQLSPSEVIRIKPSRPSDWCQFSQYQLRGNYPSAYLKDIPAKKRGYMGIEIPDFITSQDGTQAQGGGTNAKPRYFKNGR